MSNSVRPSLAGIAGSLQNRAGTRAALLTSVAVGAGFLASMTAAPTSAEASILSIGSTGCDFYSDVSGKQGSKINGVQCALTSSYDGTTNKPIPLVTQTGLLAQINQWFADNDKGVSITAKSFVGIEAFGGSGRNGDSCVICTSGKGAGGGYAVSVQTLGGMQQLIGTYGGYVDQSTPPLLFVYVGKEGKSADDQKGGGGGAGSIVMGKNLATVPEIDVLFPSGQTNAGSNTGNVDNTVFAIAGGGGAGGGARNSGGGDHGGDGGRMNGTGPVTTGDTTVAGDNGSGGNGGTGGSKAGDGVGGAAGGSGNSGASGIGGEGGLGAAFADSTFTWPYGLGGPIGGDKGLGGAGGGGWGGGGGGGEGNEHGHGGGGGGSWARQSVDPATGLPMLFNLNGSDFSLSDAGFSQVVLSFSTEDNATPLPPVPVPAPLALLFSGIAGLGVLARARRRRRK